MGYGILEAAENRCLQLDVVSLEKLEVNEPCQTYNHTPFWGIPDLTCETSVVNVHLCHEEVWFMSALYIL